MRLETEVTPTHDYLWAVKQHTLKSYIGYFTLLLALANYVCSIFLIKQYMEYMKTVANHSLDALACEVPAAWIIVSYSSLFEVTMGSILLVICVLGLLIKGCHALCIICPTTTQRVKK